MTPRYTQVTQHSFGLLSLQGRYGCEKQSCQPRSVRLKFGELQSRLLTVSRYSMARDADAAGKRTVGIITKCDVVQEGDEVGVSDPFNM